MSITFYAPDAPTRQVQPYDDEPDYVETRSTLPELNVSNMNASVVFDLLGIVGDSCGTILVADMDPIIKRLLDHNNRPNKRALHERETIQSKNMVIFGVDDDRIKYYIDTMLHLLTQCKQSNFNISWG